MYSTIKDHKSHVWLNEKTSTHRAGALTSYNLGIRAGSAMSFSGIANDLQGLSLFHVKTGSIIGINKAVF